MNTVDTREGIELIPMSTHQRGDHHHTGAFDPHFWLDPGNVKIQATTIYKALCLLDTENRDTADKEIAA